MENTKFSLKVRNETRHLAKALQITNIKVNAATNESEKVAGLMQITEY
jgi:hypothetical protein